MLTIETLFDEGFYLFQNPDVVDEIAAGNFSSGLEHFVNVGQFENRDPNALFDTSFYLEINTDIAAAIEEDNLTAVEHFLRFGQFELRDPSPLFTNLFYRANPDFATTLESAGLTPFEHFVRFGQFENRDPSFFFNTDFYLAQNQDVVELLNNGIFSSAIQHYILVGLPENRLSTPPDFRDDLLNINADFGVLGTAEFNNFIGDGNPVDVYSFMLNTPSSLDVVLTGLVGDADVELIEDINNNGVAETLEIFAESRNVGTIDEIIGVDFLPEGNYFVRVSEFSGHTNYSLFLEASPI
ncbi:MAG: calcium-binding protein [Okeania sp. SIO2G4]|uniref:PPC domain-containing protein n=1 Tax=unclassified Okeania TaxID=2634635 RepID=UPI0013BD579C|nr:MULTISPECIES: PPC domain-containing protein [unclassified Okeania]NEP04613.1 calcium-binding protein [Okeania sp. SIO4D6]NEP38104.1 calcium-binding protein [Okeania sp. SIO2H7]NEP73375.1 calcium-binding protein [Okeania sp. SIO2G5]NEP94582.1 calcium-binding protein [Okeania sp. SIO2F5]NEQ93993.1 calcium-binding protein [Okeania sp. SIO2G4]